LATTIDIEFRRGKLTSSEQLVVSEGFRTHSERQDAPEYAKERVNWLALDQDDVLRGVLTADILWDWVYVDELWVASTFRGEGIGRRLMKLVEEFAVSQHLQGIWLWTQSWQAEGLYAQLGYSEFTRFENFPKGYSRIGFRKQLTWSGAE